MSFYVARIGTSSMVERSGEREREREREKKRHRKWVCTAPAFDGIGCNVIVAEEL
jgi:hypothetical protein